MNISMKKSLIVSAFFIALFSYGFVGIPQTVEASCSWNSYYNPNGACVSSSDRDDDEYTHRNNWEWNTAYRGNNDTEYLRAQIHQLMLILASYQQHRYSSSDNNNYNNSDVNVRTQSATDVDENSATLRAIVDMNNEDEAELYFEYGRSSGNLSLKTSREDLDDNDDGDTIEVEVNGLSEDTRYYYRAVAVDEDGDKDFGTTNSFTTDGDRNNNNNDDDEPIVTTRTATDIDDESAELRGTIDMNDFDNGRAFFVYGEDEDVVSDVEDDFNSYDDVDEDGDDLQKVLVDSDVDGFDELSENISGLSDNTDIFFSLCVEYEDEDGDSTLSCGTVREFTTD